MGRKTHELIGKLLGGRTNIVLTRDLSLVAPGAVLATSLDAALSYARSDAAKRGVDEIMVIGGSDIFCRDHANGRPAGNHPCARFARRRCSLSADRREIWQEASHEEHFAGPDDDADFSWRHI